MRKNIVITIIVLLFASCSKDEVPEPVRTERTVIAYIAVACTDIEEMKQLANEIEKITDVPAHSNGTEYVKLLTTRHQSGHDKFPNTVPEAFAPD
jgi:hypothetical protein